MPDDGLERSHRIFSDFNRTVHKTSKSLDVLFDRRLPINEITMNCLQEVPLFEDRIDKARGCCRCAQRSSPPRAPGTEDSRTPDRYRLGLMGDTYVGFLVVLATVAVLGAFAAKLNIVPLEMERVAILARVVTSITAAGLLSLAFVVDKLSSTEVDLGAFFDDSTARNALAMVTLLLAAGGSGLLATLVMVLCTPTHEAMTPCVARIIPLLRRWAAGCLAVATAAVVLLFPATVVQILIAGDALRVF